VPFNVYPGPTHQISGTGEGELSGAVFLHVALTTIPAHLGVDFGPPAQYRDVGRLNFGNFYGHLPGVELVLPAQLVAVPEPNITLFAWDLTDGVEATVSEMLNADPPGGVSLPPPWDRMSQPWAMGNEYQVLGGSGESQRWYHECGPGMNLWVSSATITMRRIAAAAGGNQCFAWIEVDGQQVLRASMFGGAVGASTAESLSSGPLILGSGSVITGNTYTGDSGGDIRVTILASGFNYYNS
jgi:hypothetical protein